MRRFRSLEIWNPTLHNGEVLRGGQWRGVTEDWWSIGGVLQRGCGVMEGHRVGGGDVMEGVVV